MKEILIDNDDARWLRVRCLEAKKAWTSLRREFSEKARSGINAKGRAKKARP